MKVIDLLNMIAKGEEVPEKIEWHNLTFKKETLRDVPTLASENKIDIIEFIRARHLNDEVEIIEEDKEIEHQDMFDFFTGYDFKGTNKELLQHLETNFTTINKELSELVYEVNKLKSND